ncbi:unnamed protein product [Penicillium salamii]|uniref:V-SNARE n=1 Tax=Penicillium salamii TaxID=1612424 RepID=A0A9W4I994_9EURO|nr:unnamed protein product [Penicillium salamii]CAG7986103.1 unnamed protein product [Penicillium salamii]CAG8003322.1 unnamed protein product [Penicillium salamii]CAG8213529.1 unnamed protein product [Penicillium salamii]CAG8245841.1 unnamed protein product [Penicillium salamii]
MPDKRKGSMSSPSAKRPRLSHENEEGPSQPYEQPRQNNVYGQKGAFPGLDDGGDELFYGPADDGLEYLRMVRSEANALPTLFLARTQPSATQESESGQQNESEQPSATKPSMPIGFFAQESAYVAPAVDTNKLQDVHSPSRLEELYPSAQISYYNLLRHRFILLRSTLRCSPPAEAIRALDDLHPISLPHNAGAAHKEWRRLLMAVDPQMVQVACMDMDSVLEVLEILARMMSDVVRSEDSERIRRIGAWAWALLGKCREVGQLATEEVGIIRNLGKRAATILRKVQETENNRSQETESSVSNGEAEEDGLDGSAPNADQTTNEDEAQDASGSATEDIPEVKRDDLPDASSLEQAELEAAKAALQARLQNSDEPAATSASLDDDYLVKQTRALLDMVITVVGEFYGQRDLLETREIWS